MKNVLIASFDMEVGGVERSLISMLNNFDYEKFKVDLMLYSHTGDFLNLLPKNVHLLKELLPYKTFRMSISEIFKAGHISLGVTRLYAKYKANQNAIDEPGYKQMQYMWKNALSFLPDIEKSYDVAISYLWPHYFVAEKVKAKMKIAWIHTDFSTVETDVLLDIQMWNQFDHIIAVSEECKHAFIKKYPTLNLKVKVMENINSPSLVHELANENVMNPMLHDSRFKILTVARLSHAKGIDQAVLTLKLLKNRGYKEIAWYVVGYGGDEPLIKRLIEENDLSNSFFLLGKKLNPYPFMKATNLYVQPSRYEGKAVTVGEAQILGKPVLITNYPTAGSQVVDGINGVICGLSIEDIADGIERLYLNQHLRTTIADNCRREDFQNVNELEKLYQLV